MECVFLPFKRAVVGMAIWIALPSLLLISPMPYGGGSQGILFLVGVTATMLFLQALAGFVAPGERLLQTLSSNRMPNYFAAAKLTAVLVGLGLSTGCGTGEKQARANDRESGIRVCTSDLNAISAPVSVQSLLIDSGVAPRTVLRELLGGRGLHFVELRPKAGQDWRTQQKTFGVFVTDGDFPIDFDVAPSVKIVRLSLSKNGDPSCTRKAVLGLDYMGDVPMDPDACLRVELDQQSRASHILKAIPADGRPAFIKWAVVEQATAKVLVALTSSDDPLRPSRQAGGAKDEQKAIDGDILHCRSPHDSLMNITYGPPRSSNERLSLGTRIVKLDMGLIGTANLTSWDSVEVPEQIEMNWNDKRTARAGPAWKDAYRAAEKSGWAPYERSVIDFGAGVIIRPSLASQTNQSHTMVRGSKTGFMVAWPTGINSVGLRASAWMGNYCGGARSSPPTPCGTTSPGLIWKEWSGIRTTCDCTVSGITQ
jgi:hypothetical protein